MIVYHMEERERIKIVDYRNTKGESIAIIKRSDNRHEAAREEHRDPARFVPRRRLDPQGQDRAPRDDGGEGLHQTPRSRHKVSPVTGGPKLVNVTFTVGEGRRSRSATSTSSATRRSATASCRRR
jgi:hypothetical protein